MPRTPELKAPPGACDSHLHIYGARDRYPWVEVPERPFLDCRLEHYLKVRDRLGLERTVVVQATHYDTDNQCLLDTVAALGDSGRGIAVVDPAITDEELAALNAGGVRGLRFGADLANGMRPDALETMAARIAPFGWHIQYRCGPQELLDLEDRIRKLPVDICFDHMGNIDPATGISHPAFKALLGLLCTGRCWVKLSAPYQLSHLGGPDYADYFAQGCALVAANPERLVWGTNWPHPRVEKKPDEADLLDVLNDWAAGDEKVLQAILTGNPAKLYGF